MDDALGVVADAGFEFPVLFLRTNGSIVRDCGGAELGMFHDVSLR